MEQKRSFLNRPVGRTLLIWAIHALAFALTSLIVNFINQDYIRVNSLRTAVFAVAVITLLNALLWPILSRILLPFAVLTLGLVSLMLNGLMIWIAAWILPGFYLADYWIAFWMALGITALTLILSHFLTINDDGTWERNQVMRRVQKQKKPIKTAVPGILFLEIDGLSTPILQQAIKEGHVPNIAKWIEDGSHVLTEWETDTSSQTSASQAGILHGDNSNIPAFRWYDKEKGEICASGDMKYLPIMEKERSNGDGLLADGGVSRGNLLSGDAVSVMNTASTITDTSKFHTSDFGAFFANPDNASRTFVRFIGDIIQEKREYRYARKNNVQPILDKQHRGGIYPLLRAAMVVLMMDLNIDTLLGDIFAGVPSAYATFVGYDEIAHHSGVTDPGAFKVLHKLDHAFGRLAKAVEAAPRPYHIVILSDHGQSSGATFLQRYGMTLEKFVHQLMDEESSVVGMNHGDESNDQLTFLLSDIIHNAKSGVLKSVAHTSQKQVNKKQAAHNANHIHDKKNDDKPKGAKPDIYALASGNLGLISFTAWPKRMTLEEIEADFPNVVPGLAKHEGVGFVMVNSEKNGPVVIGEKGFYYLDTDEVKGENPLAGFGKRAAEHLRRTNSFSNCPDILVNSFYDEETNEGCAFEELIGFHGGLGGWQTRPFILHPVEFKAEGEIVSAENVYRLGKEWLAQVASGNGK